MAYVFISHASEDKPRVRPLAKALALEGLNLWLDRPGHGPSHFNFDRGFIARYGIRELQTGLPWNAEISRALKESGAVVLCLSRSLCEKRTVLLHEIVVGAHLGKLAACIVDDLPYTQMPSDTGLVDLSRLQAERIDPRTLEVAADEVEAGTKPERLSTDLRSQWEIIRKLTADIRKIFDASGVDTATPDEIERARIALSRFPIAPAVRAFDIPVELITLFADRFASPPQARRFVALAMQITSDCNPEGFAKLQILVRPGEVRNETSAEEYWTDVLTLAGAKSRRTLASLLTAPGAPRTHELPAQLATVMRDFLTWLEQPPP